eukprot:9466842-Alexandrium_andersonii.AAC.1
MCIRDRPSPPDLTRGRAPPASTRNTFRKWPRPQKPPWPPLEGWQRWTARRPLAYWRPATWPGSASTRGT